ncbi:tannase/feruloyl esterase family alpha/beta hydrolase [Novosphingobium resinovorum]|uniref:Tannase and feruloyl esterase n=2 Tax=Novosphingobium resinovorum TaxID=158500 RepID=A0A031J5P9_9SPHN|nr:tannase/feruloyl esterase family alpha/beta hydrolase [Novosphingobium resinovorum]EZP68576.1 Tannase and feruloyl esterase [Novosphingobium resinovorum]
MKIRYMIHTALAAALGCAGFTMTAAPAHAAGQSCDNSIKATFKPDDQTTVVLVHQFRKGEVLRLNEPKTPFSQQAANDVCLVKLLVGPGHPGPDGAPSTSPGIGLEVWLPSSPNWNGRVHAVGGGGYNGGPHGTPVAIGDGRAGALASQEGSVTSSSDGGHPRSGAVPGMKGGGDFGMNPDGSLNQVLWQDFASRAVHEQALKTKALATLFYGRAPHHSYFEGSSNGGREAYSLAQNHPEDYDGIVGNLPAINWSTFIIGGLYPQLVFQRDLGGVVPTYPQQDLVSQAAIHACDVVGGVHLGYIMDTAACRYDPTKDRAVLCRTDGGSNETADCVTRKQARAFNKIWYGATVDGTAPDPAVDNGWKSGVGGKRIWFGYNRGTSLYNATFSKLFRTNAGVTNTGGPFSHSSDMVALALGDARLASTNFENATGDGADGWKQLSYADLAKAAARAEASQAQFGNVDTKNPNLQAFRARGGKLLGWHGVNDEAIPVQGSMRYYDQVAALQGGPARVQAFYRLYIVPGVGHATPNGTANPAANPPVVSPAQFFKLLVEWVENGKAPERIDLQSPGDKPVMRTQPICPYPQRAVYVQGDPNHAASFKCGEK